MLELPNVSILQMETQVHRLAKLALDDSLRGIKFGQILVATDQFKEMRVPNAEHVMVYNWANKLGYCQALWYTIPKLVKTSHLLITQWDSWVLRPDLWNPEFTNYDYIGAPWDMGPKGLVVGNSGFSLRSKRLMDFMIEHKQEFPLQLSGEDAQLSLVYRAKLEDAGFTWAPIELAKSFSMEGNACRHESPMDSFGFHGIFHWPEVLDKERLIERARLAKSSKYIRSSKFTNGYSMFDSLVANAPWLRWEI